jgi:hypothetical protein
VVEGFSPEEVKEAYKGLTVRERAELDLLLARIPPPPMTLFADSFPEQKAYCLDESRLKFLFCTRRAAKSFSFGLECANDQQEHPKVNYLFLGLTREEAKRIFWKDVLKELDLKFNLQCSFNESSLTCTFPNGATIYIGAADANETEWRKLLGQKYRKVFIDEAQDWKLDLDDLVYSTLKPATTDFSGSITLAGTPGRTRVGLFYDLTCNSIAGALKPGRRGDGWKGHSWTTFANTAVVEGRRMCDRWRDDIEELKATHPRIEETPAFRHNYKGEWVIDDDALCYKYNAGRNGWDGVVPFFSRGTWHRVLAVDLGYNDDTSFTRMQYHDFSPNLLITKSDKKSGMDISAVANRIKLLQETEGPFEITVIDGSNKQAVMEMQNRHGLSLWPADKAGKPDFIELMNAEFIMGRIMVNEKECVPLVEEWAGLVWNDKTTKREEHPACPNHCTDGALYGWRYCYQYVSKTIVNPPEPGSPAAIEAERKRLFEAAQRDVAQMKEGQSPFGPGLGGDTFEWGNGG